MINNLFDTVFGDKSIWNDDFPSCDEWKSEIEKWLLYIQDKGQLDRYQKRFQNVTKAMRDEALDEICCAYMIEVLLGYPVDSWEVKTINNRDVDFVVKDGADEIFCEVKSPGWESELNESEKLGSRKLAPKFIDGEARWVGSWQAIRHSIKKAYPKYLSDRKNLLIIKDDLYVHILNNLLFIDVALFMEDGLYGGEVGYFHNKQYQNLGAILFLDCRLTSRFEYRHKLCKNRNAIKPFSMSINEIV